MAGPPPHRPNLTFVLLLCGALLQAAALSLEEVHAPVYRKRVPSGQKEEVESEALSGMYSAATARKVARFLKELEDEMARREENRNHPLHLEKKTGSAPSSYPTKIFSQPLPALKRKSPAVKKRSAVQRKRRGEPAVLGELQSILRDEDVKKVPPEVKRQEKRQSDKEAFKDWVRREYYRNLARSFASMRRKRSGWSSGIQRHLVSVDNEPDQFQEVTDKLKAIENALLSDALSVIQRGTDADGATEISNDLNAAYDLETMRIALSHLKETLARMEETKEEEEEEEKPKEAETVEKKSDNDVEFSDLSDIYSPDSSDSMAPAVQKTTSRREGVSRCPPLNLLTSDCSALGDVMMDGALRDLMLYACNWHEVCYSCGEAFGLTAEDCDVGFVEESRTICQGDVPCQTTAEMLLLPLRQRRVFYKRSNPAVCYVDPCVLAFLRQD